MNRCAASAAATERADPDFQRLGDQHLIRAVEYRFKLFGAPRHLLGQRRQGAENPQLRGAPVHMPQARSGAFSRDDNLFERYGLISRRERGGQTPSSSTPISVQVSSSFARQRNGFGFTGTGANHPVPNAVLASSIRSCDEATKFHQM